MKAINSQAYVNLRFVEGVLTDCLHENTVCLNHFEFFRKYMCRYCGKVWMCECEKELAPQFLPHQVKYGTEYGTHLRYPVSGFAKNICSTCRGQKEEAHPLAAIYGQKGKVERYYWREIFKTYLESVRSWLAERNIAAKDIMDLERRFPEEAKHMKKEAKKIWQYRHKNAPKYDARAIMLTTQIIYRVWKRLKNS